LILFFIFLLFLIGLVSSISDEGDYFVNMGNISQRIYSGEANVLFIGDSITTNTATPRIFYGVIRKWSPLNWRGIITQGSSGVSDQGTIITNEPTSASTKITVEAGQNYTLPNGSIIRGWNLGKVAFYNFSSNQGSFGTAIRMGVNTPYNVWSNDWTNMTNLTTRFIYLSSPASSPYEVRIRNHWRNGTLAPAVEPLTLLNSTPFGIYYLENNFTNSDGSSPTYMTLTIGTRNESLDDSEFYPLATRIFRNDIDTGLQIGYSGGGGYTTKSHTREGEFLTIDSERINTSYSQEALERWVDINDLNTFLIWLGQNSAGDEWNGALARNYSQNVRNIITRYTDAYYNVTESSSQPYFILVSTYDTNVDNSKHVALEQALTNLSVNDTITNAQIGFINLRKFVNDTNGSWMEWNSSYTGDGIHPSQDGALYFAETLWDQIVLGLSNPTATMNGLTWISDSYRVSNHSLGNQAISLNNTGFLSGSIEVSGLTNALLFNKTDICSGSSSDINSNDDEFNITVPSNHFCYVLNYFNLTEGIERNNSPVWLSSATTSLKSIASNLTDTVNMTVLFNVDSCSTIDTISYASHTGTYTKSYSSSEYSCSDSIVTLNVSGLEPAEGSNNITITYLSVSAAGSSNSPGRSAPVFNIKITSLEEGYTNTFYENWGITFFVSEEEHRLIIDEILNESVVVSISSEPITEEVFLGKPEKFDLNNDGYYDLRIEVNEISASKRSAGISFNSIYEKIPAQEEESSEGLDDEEEILPFEGLPKEILFVFIALFLAILFFLIRRFGVASAKKK